MDRLLLFKDSGEFGNRLVTHAYLKAYALEHGLHFQSLALWRYARYINGHSAEATFDVDRPSSPLERWLAAPTLRNLLTRFDFDGHLLLDPRTLSIRAANAIATRTFATLRPFLALGQMSVIDDQFQDHTCS